MKYIIIIAIFLIGCKAKLEPVPQEQFYTAISEGDTYAPPDTVYIHDTIRIECLTQPAVIRLQKQRDSLRTALFISNYKIERVRYYLGICLRDKTQDKFLKGWVRRAVE